MVKIKPRIVIDEKKNYIILSKKTDQRRVFVLLYNNYNKTIMINEVRKNNIRQMVA